MQTTETVWVIRFSKFFLQLNSTFKINNFQSLLNFEKESRTIHVRFWVIYAWLGRAFVVV